MDGAYLRAMGVQLRELKTALLKQTHSYYYLILTLENLKYPYCVCVCTRARGVRVCACVFVLRMCETLQLLPFVEPLAFP